MGRGRAAGVRGAGPVGRAGPGARSRRTSRPASVHIKSSFNSTIVSVSDQEGNVIAWESAGALGSGAYSKHPIRGQMTQPERREQGDGSGTCGAWTP